MKKKLLIITAVFSFIIPGCVDLPENVILPEWDVNASIPFINKSYTLDQIINSSEYLNIEPSPTDNIFLIQSDIYSGETSLGNYIKISNEKSLQNLLLYATNSEYTPVYLSFPNGVELDSAVFNSGNISVKVENPTNVDITASFLFPGILDPSGNYLIIQFNLPANNSDSVSYDLTGHKYTVPSNQISTNKNSLQLIPSVNAQVSTGAFIVADFYSSDFYFEKVSGKLPQTYLGNKEIPLSVEYGNALDFRDKLFIKEAVFNLASSYQSSYFNPFELALYNTRIIGKRNDGLSMELLYNDNRPINIEFDSGEFDLMFSESNSNINEFLAFFPDSLFISADFYINPENDNSSRSASVFDQVKFDADFQTRSVFALKNTTIADTSLINFTEENREAIRNGKGAELTIEVENAIPFTSFIKIVLTDKNFNPLITLTQNIDGTDSIKFAGGEINEVTGEVMMPVKSTIKSQFNSSEFSLVAEAYYAIISTTIRTKNADDGVSDPPFVNIKSTDWINIRCYGNVDYRVDLD